VLLLAASVPKKETNNADTKCHCGERQNDANDDEISYQRLAVKKEDQHYAFSCPLRASASPR
jgi:hypothetical protein